MTQRPVAPNSVPTPTTSTRCHRPVSAPGDGAKAAAGSCQARSEAKAAGLVLPFAAGRVGDLDSSPLPHHLPGELGRGTSRTIPDRNRRAAKEEALRLDLDARARQAWIGAAALQGRRRKHDRSARRPGRGARQRGTRDFPVQGLSSLHGGKPQQSGDRPPPARRGLPPPRHVQDDCRRRADAPHGSRPFQGRDRRGAGPADAHGLRPAARPHYRRRQRQAWRADPVGWRRPRAAAAGGAGSDDQGGGKRLRQDAGRGRPTGRRRRHRRLQRETADHQEERPLGVLRCAGGHFPGRRPGESQAVAGQTRLGV